MDNRVVVEELDGYFHLYNEAGHCVEGDFETQEEALQYCDDNELRVVKYFNDPPKTIENFELWLNKLPVQTLTDELKRDILEKVEELL